jgi:uncharacterized hydrophobic protein (TIGR00271 family)
MTSSARSGSSLLPSAGAFTLTRVSNDDLARMRDKLLFDGPAAAHKLTNFCVLLVLAAIIASAGVIADSTATVIGAMIVAPLMTPILGTVLSVTTSDRVNLLRSLLLVVAGAAAVVIIAFVIGAAGPVGTTSQTSSQVSGRIHPGLIDLVAALATGAVGSFALARTDVSDTLPGVAIAISLVPPLAVVGLTLQAGASDESAGALLLFLTNVAAILLTGLIVMALFGVHETAREVDHRDRVAGRGKSLALVAILLVLLAVPLGVSTATLTKERLETSDVSEVAEAWAAASGWEIATVHAGKDGAEVRALGPPPAPDPQALRAALDAAGLASVDVKLELVPEQRLVLPGKQP